MRFLFVFFVCYVCYQLSLVKPKLFESYIRSVCLSYRAVHLSRLYFERYVVFFRFDLFQFVFIRSCHCYCRFCVC